MQRQYRVVLVAALLSLGAVAWGFANGSTITGQWQLAARYTARIGFPIFIVTYAASSLFCLWPGDMTRAFVQDRRQWGLAFALAHSVHLAALTGFNMVTRHMPDVVTLIGGGGAYAVMYAMAVTSNTASMRMLGVHWKTLHRLGIHWLWLVFTFSYFGRLFDPERAMIGYVFFPLCIAAMLVRLAAWRRNQNRVVTG